MTYLDSHIERKIKLWVRQEEKRLAAHLAKPNRPYTPKNYDSRKGGENFYGRAA